MKRIITFVGFVPAFVAVVALAAVTQRSHASLTPAVQAQTNFVQEEPARPYNNRHKSCSAATLKGSYGVRMEGTVLNWPPPFPTGPLAAVGIVTFDGEGKYTGSDTLFRLNGVTIPFPEYGGDYVVNSDCTGALYYPQVGAVFNLLVVDDGREYRVLWGPGDTQVINGLGKKIAPPPADGTAFERSRAFYCNPGMVAGAYAITWRGSLINPPPLPPSPLTGLTLFTHNEDGAVNVKGIFDHNGVKQPADTTLVTQVGSNCLFTAGNDTDRYFGVFVDGANEYFVLALSPPTAPSQEKVMYGFAKRIH